MHSKKYKHVLTSRKRYLLLLLFLIFSLQACRNNQEANPKPHAYPRIDFPEKTYQSYEDENCSFSFVYPGYARVNPKSFSSDQDKAMPCWFDLVVPELNASLHCSYYEISATNRLDSLIFDSFTLVGKHNIKAQYIEETPLDLKNGGGGMLFRIKGPVASPTQFFVTDSINHFFRGSLYFYNKVQLDSMRIVHDFIDEDIDVMLESFYWK